MSKLQDYTVTWDMVYYAESHEEAVQQAIGTLQDPANTATVFTVTAETGETKLLDAENPDEIITLLDGEY